MIISLISPKMIEIGKGGQRAVRTTLLSRYACYLAIQNADPGKPRVALGQTYFAVQTRRQELSDEAIEDERRLRLRQELRTHNVQLADAAKGAGVILPRDYAIFQNHGYMGLYGVCMVVSRLRIFTAARASNLRSRFSTIWEALNLLPTCSEPLRRKRSCVVRVSSGRPMQTVPIAKWVLK